MRLFLFGVAMAMASLSAMAVDVIVHKDVLVSQIGLASARAIFGMRQVKWPDGSLIRVFVLGDQHPLHVALCKEELNIYPYQLRQSWDRLVYSGMAQAPRQVESEEEMAALVAATPGAIGYVNKTKNNPSIRVLHVD